MAIENFTSYTEVDPNSKLTVLANKVTWASLNRGEDCYLYLDKGAGYFAADFEHLFTYRVTAASNHSLTHLQIWTLANLVDDFRGIDVAGGDALTISAKEIAGTFHMIVLMELDGGTEYPFGEYTVTIDTDYYLKVKRDESVGTYGTLYLYIYSDAARTNLLTTISGALHTSKKDFRYIYPVQSRNTGEAVVTHSGYTEDLELFLSPTVTIQAVTNIVTTTAKGHGNVTDLGGAAVTEHGHCWDLEANPTPDTGDSKTTLGAKSATGTFVSSITGLTGGQTYAVRAYATSSYGTGYSSELTFVAGTAGAQSYPTDAQTRVTSLIHRFDRGTYTLELLLGEVTADFGLPEPESRPKPAFLDEQEREIEQMLRRDKAIKERQTTADEEKMREQDRRLWVARDELREEEVGREKKMREQDRRLWAAADRQAEEQRAREEAQRREIEQMLAREEARKLKKMQEQDRRLWEAAGQAPKSRAPLPSETLTEEQRRLLRGF